MAFGASETVELGPQPMPSGLSGAAQAVWQDNEPVTGVTAGGLPVLPSTRQELEAIADDGDGFGWEFLSEMRASIVHSKAGILPLRSDSPSNADIDDAGGESAEEGDDKGDETGLGGEITSARDPGLRRQGSFAVVVHASDVAGSEGHGAHPGPTDTSAATAEEDKPIAEFAVAYEALMPEAQAMWFTRAVSQLEHLWEDAKVSGRDREVFRNAHCEPPLSASKAVAIAQHLSLLAEHVSSLDSIKAAIRRREDGIRLLGQVLASFEQQRLKPRTTQGQPVHPPQTDSRADGRIGLPGAVMDDDDAASSSAGTRSRPPLSRPANWQARGVVHDTGAAAGMDLDEMGGLRPGELAPELRLIVLKHRVRCRVMMLHILRSSVEIVEQVRRWRRTMWRPHSFLWRGRSYLRKMRKDLSFLAQEPAAGLMDYLSVPKDEIRILLAFWRPPAWDGRGLEAVPGDPDSRFGSVLGLCKTDMLVPDLRIIGRVDRCLAVVHGEKELQRRLQRETDRLEHEGLFVPVMRWRLAPGKPQPRA
jgi:hypothetical protein